MVAQTVFRSLFLALLAGYTSHAVPAANHYLGAPPSNETSPKSLSDLSTSSPIPDPSRYPEYQNFTPTWLKCVSLTGVAMRLEAIPGMGWDSLSNRRLGPITDLSYERCQTTPDGKYLLTDSVTTVPLKTSEVQEYADMFSDFEGYKSSTSQSMSLEVSFTKIGGTFSDDYQSNKKHMVSGKSTTFRTEIRHQMYLVEVKPDAPLSPGFKQRLMTIADLLHRNRERAAKYEMDLIIRDFGTHIVRSVVAGGIFQQESQVRNEYVGDFQSSVIKAFAAASFFVKVGFNYSTSPQSMSSYQSNVTQSTTKTIGGPAYRDGMTVSDWEDGLPNALVAVDHQGDPIEYVLSPSALPEIPEPTVRRIADGLADASKRYIKYNTHMGCTDLSSPSFNYKANHGYTPLCELAPNNYTFGGTYQTCTSGESYGRDVCTPFMHKNPLSGHMECPTGYETILLHTGKDVVTWTGRVCQEVDCGFLETFLHPGGCYQTVCHTQYYSVTPEYQTYWCVRLGKVQVQSGYLFGGIYSPSSPNQLTGTVGCPKFFYALKIGGSASVCVSENYEQGFASSLPFGGFFSCGIGNPLALANASNGAASSLDQLGFGYNTGQDSFPHHCPHGYAQHLAVVDADCDIEYCVKAHAFDEPSRMLLNRPPYGKRYPWQENTTVVTLAISAPGGETWSKNITTGQWAKESLIASDFTGENNNTSPTESSEHLSSRTATIIGLLTSLCFILFVVLVITCRRATKKSFKAIGEYERLKRDGPVATDLAQAPTAINTDATQRRTGYTSHE